MLRRVRFLCAPERWWGGAGAAGEGRRPRCCGCPSPPHTHTYTHTLPPAAACSAGRAGGSAGDRLCGAGAEPLRVRGSPVSVCVCVCSPSAPRPPGGEWGGGRSTGLCLLPPNREKGEGGGRGK